MKLEKYATLADHRHEAYEFLSEGPRGAIRKVVQYQRMDRVRFNLAFGDWDELSQKIVDSVRSNNQDRDKVLATVAFTLVDFMEHHPDAIVFAQGSTAAKTRLYQMGINANWHDIGFLFEIYGYRNSGWEIFQGNANYSAFVVKAK